MQEGKRLKDRYPSRLIGLPTSIVVIVGTGVWKFIRGKGPREVELAVKDGCVVRH